MVSRNPMDIGRYTMTDHKKDTPNPQRYWTLSFRRIYFNCLKVLFQSSRHELWFFGKQRYNTDGLNSLNFTMLSVETKPLFTKINVFYHKKQIISKYDDRKNNDPYSKRIMSSISSIFYFIYFIMRKYLYFLFCN
jgi:hypothetical protein